MYYSLAGISQRLYLAVLLLMVGSFAGEVWAQSTFRKPMPPVIGHEPWSPPSGIEPKVIYGEDDRIDIYQEQDPAIVSWSHSVCALVSTNRLTQQSNGNYQLSTSSYTQLGLPPCAGEPFANQPTAARCTGFVVGEDLIATAGHCYNASDLNGTRFVFGFVMENSNTPVLNFTEDQVYRGVEVVARQYTFDNDYSIIRVDRPITAPGARPLPIRREGNVSVGTQVGAIGHPAGLPIKIAFGDETVVRDSSNPYYFVANLDTFGGNSGSPIFNQNSGVVEGILVRGEVDYVRNNNCFESNVFSNTGGRGEDSSKTTAFAQHVPHPADFRELQLSRTHYSCFDSLSVQVHDESAPMGHVEVTVMAQSGDIETLELTEELQGSHIFRGNLPILEGESAPNNGILDVIDGDLITVIYDSGQGADAMMAEALIDCVPPEIEGITLLEVGSAWATIGFQTNKVSTSRIYYGTRCDDLQYQVTDLLHTDHQIILSGLTPNETYYFTVEATDRAGNVTTRDNQGACYSFTTHRSIDYFTNVYQAPTFALEYTQLSFKPNNSTSGYELCVTPVADFEITPYGGEELILDDDGFVPRELSGDVQLRLFGQSYDKVYIGSNGYLTFMTGDTEYQPSLEHHFQQPRISPLFTDLNPEMGGYVYYAQLSDRIVVSFVEMPIWDFFDNYGPDNSNTFQVEVFYSGKIRYTYLDVSTEDSIVGLSRGLGLQSDYDHSEHLAYPDCFVSPEEQHSADSNADGVIDLHELLRVVQLYAYGAYHCDDVTEDGFAPGDGPTDCVPHDSDYAPQDWQIDLSELLRLVQLYQADGYQMDGDSEDGFAPYYTE